MPKSERFVALRILNLSTFFMICVTRIFAGKVAVIMNDLDSGRQEQLATGYFDEYFANHNEDLISSRKVHPTLSQNSMTI